MNKEAETREGHEEDTLRLKTAPVPFWVRPESVIINHYNIQVYKNKTGVERMFSMRILFCIILYSEIVREYIKKKSLWKRILGQS